MNGACILCNVNLNLDVGINFLRKARRKAMIQYCLFREPWLVCALTNRQDSFDVAAAVAVLVLYS